MVERFTPTADSRIHYEATVEDPVVLTVKWKVMDGISLSSKGSGYDLRNTNAWRQIAIFPICKSSNSQDVVFQGLPAKSMRLGRLPDRPPFLFRHRSGEAYERPRLDLFIPLPRPTGASISLFNRESDDSFLETTSFYRRTILK